MKLRHARATILASIIAVSPTVSWAQTGEALTLEQAAAKLAALQAQLEAVQAEVAALRAQAAQNAQPAPPPAAQPAAVQQAAATPPPNPVKVSWKGAPEISQGGWSFKPRGRVIFDAGHVSSPSGISDPGLGFSNELRRGRLGVQGTVPGKIGYRFELDFAADTVEVVDAYIDMAFGAATITVGQHNNFQSLDELSSTLHSSFLERSAFTDAFGFARRLGISAQVKGDAWLVQAGVFTDNLAALSDDANNSRSVDGRVVFHPKLGETQLHFGASGHYRDLGDAAGTVRYRQRPAIHTTDVRFIGTSALPVTAETSYGLEAAAIMGPWYAAAETHWLNASLAGMADATFFGGYVETGFFFTGESRGYRAGIFDRVKVLDPLSEGGMGALSLNVRYDHLDLSDAGIIGGTQNGYQASLVWKPSDYLLFALNLSHLDYDDAAIARTNGDRSYGVDVVGVRSQFDF